jgi:hypothetical protein
MATGLIVAALLLPALAACGTGTLDGPTPTPQAGGTGCAADVTIGAVTEPTTPAGGTPVIPATPTPGQPADAPAYAEIQAKIEALRAILAGVTTQEEYEQHEAEIKQAQADIAALWNSLPGKSIKGWQGWVIATGKDAARMGLNMGLEVPESALTSDSAVLLALFDPFAPGQVPAATANKMRAMASGFISTEPFVVVSDPASGGKSLCLGQKVAFEGVVDKAFYQGEKLGMYLPQASLTITEDKLAGLKPFAGMEGVAVQFERSMCFGICPDYSITVFGNGAVLFHGRYHTRIQGFRIATIDRATVQKLLDALDNAGFDKMPSYTNYEVTDLPYAYITLVRDGNTHRVEHYHGDSSAPDSLTALENSMDEILNTAQWVE